MAARLTDGKYGGEANDRNLHVFPSSSTQRSGQTGAKRGSARRYPLTEGRLSRFRQARPEAQPRICPELS